MQEAPPNSIVRGPEGLDETVEVDGRPLAIFGWSSALRSRNRGCSRST
jgi:hypothetical protein